MNPEALNAMAMLGFFGAIIMLFLGCGQNEDGHVTTIKWVKWVALAWFVFWAGPGMVYLYITGVAG